MHKNLSTLAALLALLMTTAGCASHTPEIGLGTPTASGKPAACLSLQVVRANRGKPGGATVADVSAALVQDHPVERVRNLVGDTSQTLTQVDRNNAALSSLCGESHAQ